MKKNLLLEINALRSLIREHDHNYFVLNNPTISDYEYDQLFKKLVELEKENPELITPDSPTQRVGSDLVKDFKSVKRENFRLQQQEVMELAAKMLPQMLKQSALYL